MPLTLGFSNHQWLPFSFAEDLTVDSFFRLKNICSDSSRKIVQEIKRSDLANEIRSSCVNNWVISSEHLQSCLTSEDEILALRSELSKYFDKIDVLLYVRNPIDTAVSAWSTRIKCGVHSQGIPKPIDRRISTVCNHKKTITNWSRAFGRKSLNVRLFHANSLLDGNIIADFVSFILPGQDISFLDSPQRQNESLSALGATLLNQVLLKTNVKLNSAKYRAYQVLAQYILKRTKDCGTLVADNESTFNYQHYFNDSNKWLKENYFPNLFDLWPSESEEVKRRCHLKKTDQIWEGSSTLYRLSPRGNECVDLLCEALAINPSGKVNMSISRFQFLDSIDLVELVKQP